MMCTGPNDFQFTDLSNNDYRTRTRYGTKESMSLVGMLILNGQTSASLKEPIRRWCATVPVHEVRAVARCAKTTSTALQQLRLYNNVAIILSRDLLVV